MATTALHSVIILGLSWLFAWRLHPKTWRTFLLWGKHPIRVDGRSLGPTTLSKTPWFADRRYGAKGRATLRFDLLCFNSPILRKQIIKVFLCQEELVLAQRGDVLYQPCFGFSSRVVSRVARTLFDLSNQALEHTGRCLTLVAPGLVSELSPVHREEKCHDKHNRHGQR